MGETALHEPTPSELSPSIASSAEFAREKLVNRFAIVLLADATQALFENNTSSVRLPTGSAAHAMMLTGGVCGIPTRKRVSTAGQPKPGLLPIHIGVGLQEYSDIDPEKAFRDQ